MSVLLLSIWSIASATGIRVTASVTRDGSMFVELAASGCPFCASTFSASASEGSSKDSWDADLRVLLSGRGGGGR